jgi:hypothetical protein
MMIVYRTKLKYQTLKFRTFPANLNGTPRGCISKKTVARLSEQTTGGSMLDLTKKYILNLKSADKGSLFMSICKFLVLILILVLVYDKSECGNEFIKFVFLKCVASTEHFYPNYTCYARSQNRSFSALNGFILARKPVFEIWVSFNDFTNFKNLLLQLLIF